MKYIVTLSKSLLIKFLNRVVEGKTLHDKLFALYLELLKEKKYNSEKAKIAIQKAINEHLVSK